MEEEDCAAHENAEHEQERRGNMMMSPSAANKDKKGVEGADGDPQEETILPYLTPAGDIKLSPFFITSETFANE